MIFIQERSSRRNRMINIARWYVANYEKYKGRKVSMERVRSEIREALNLSDLDGEDKLGDLRAHGDACGGHGLHLHTARARQYRGQHPRSVLIMDDQNLQTCVDFINDLENDDVVW